MESKQENWSLLTFKELAGNINPNPPTYQRDSGVWKLDQEQLLIDSVLRKIDIPKIYLRKLDSGPFEYEVVDGQQRIRTLWRFLQDEFPLDVEARDLPVNGQIYLIANKKYSELDSPVKVHRIHTYQLTVVIISQAADDEVADLFYRLNNGEPLTAAEVRNSMPGEVTKFIRQLAAHPFFKKCGFKNSRRTFDQMAAQMLCLELKGGLTDISDKFLTPMYKDYANGVPNKVAITVEKNLDLLDQMFPGPSKLLKRAVVINLYLLISYLTKHRKISGALKDMLKWFEKTEIIRQKDPEYRLLMTRGANGRPSIEGRFRWILSEFMTEFEKFQIVELDPRRNFNNEQKAEIFIRDGKKCQGTLCGGKIIKDGENWHSDHIVPWFHGGRTEISNGQVLCPTCNLRKGAKFWEVSA